MALVQGSILIGRGELEEGQDDGVAEIEKPIGSCGHAGCSAARGTVLTAPNVYVGAAATEARSTTSVFRTTRVASALFPLSRSTNSLAAASPRP